jgi:hypothetical protein
METARDRVLGRAEVRKTNKGISPSQGPRIRARKASRTSVTYLVLLFSKAPSTRPQYIFSMRETLEVRAPRNATQRSSS